MKTDYEKLKMRLKWHLQKVWFGNEKLKTIGETREVDLADWFLNQYPNVKEAITEAYFLGRQAGRLSLGTEVAHCLGMDDEDIAALKEGE